MYIYKINWLVPLVLAKTTCLLQRCCYTWIWTDWWMHHVIIYLEYNCAIGYRNVCSVLPFCHPWQIIWGITLPVGVNVCSVLPACHPWQFTWGKPRPVGVEMFAVVYLSAITAVTLRSAVASTCLCSWKALFWMCGTLDHGWVITSLKLCYSDTDDKDVISLEAQMRLL